ncbi:MAG: polyhydroxyalkanoate synthesis repressor PhaR [Alphaproteobacteria bacterium]|jgi:polyhydroxyalkanoate synthesis repressor PhaR|nr:polyhydroxyalkanoate synthesis repressor PhaR [Alphaproteobacteria bacterium]
MAKTKHGKDEPTVIKKYANRRLYDTGRSSYVTLDDLCEMVKDGYDFVVYDAKTGDDITRSVLTQIIAEKETSGGQTMLPTGFLRKLIGFYGDGVQPFVPNYLETTIDLFVKNQERLREQMSKSMQGFQTMNPMSMASNLAGNMNPMANMANMKGMFPTVPPALEEMNRQNMAMFERTMKMFTPFSMGSASSNADGSKEEKIKDLKKTIREMEQELNRLAAE